MSYCSCFICGVMVPWYEKYCQKCLELYKLKQGDWRKFRPKTEFGTSEREDEIQEEIRKDSLQYGMKKYVERP